MIQTATLPPTSPTLRATTTPQAGSVAGGGAGSFAESFAQASDDAPPSATTGDVPPDLQSPSSTRQDWAATGNGLPIATLAGVGAVSWQAAITPQPVAAKPDASPVIPDAALLPATVAMPAPVRPALTVGRPSLSARPPRSSGTDQDVEADDAEDTASVEPPGPVPMPAIAALREDGVTAILLVAPAIADTANAEVAPSATPLPSRSDRHDAVVVQTEAARSPVANLQAGVDAKNGSAPPDGVPEGESVRVVRRSDPAQSGSLPLNATTPGDTALSQPIVSPARQTRAGEGGANLMIPTSQTATKRSQVVELPLGTVQAPAITPSPIAGAGTVEAAWESRLQAGFPAPFAMPTRVGPDAMADRRSMSSDALPTDAPLMTPPVVGTPRWTATEATAPVELAVAQPGAVQPQPGTVASAAQVFGAAIQVASKARDDTEAKTGSLESLLGSAAPAPLVQSAPATAQHAALDMRQERWPHAMIERIDMLRDAANATDTRIRLIPDALGAIDVSMRKDGDTVHVHFNAEQAATRTLLADAQPRLAELAEARGLKLGQAMLGDGNTSSNAGSSQQRAPATTNAPNRATAASAVIADPTEDTRIA
jgi:hypothetical protein